MKVTYDKKTNALYIYFTPDGHKVKGIVKETEIVRDNIMADINEEGELFGVEILDPSEKVVEYLRAHEFVELEEEDEDKV